MGESASRFKIAVAIVNISSGASLLALVALRWIGFLGLPPVVFLTLLFSGMPLGGMLLERIGRLRRMSFPGIVGISAGMGLVGLVLFVFFVSMSSFAVRLSDADIPQFALSYAIRILVKACALLPLFIGYGMAELAAYRRGMQGLSGKSSIVYTLNLSGLLLSFIIYRLLLGSLGTTGLGVLGFAFLASALLVLGSRKMLGALVTAALLGTLFIPGLENRADGLLDIKTGPSTFNNWKSGTNRVLYDAWTPFCKLSIVDQGWGISGFYDGMFYWFYSRNMPDPHKRAGSYRRLDLVFSLLVKSGNTVAVLGSGGGAQVAAALRAGAGKVFAVEVMPDVLRVLSGPLAASVERTYNDRRVVLVPKNARRFLDETAEKFDFIIVASLESHLGGFRSLFEPSQEMFTTEAFEAMRDHLKPGGTLFISKATAVDRRGVIFNQAFNQLEKIGLRTRGYIQLPSFEEKPPLGYKGIMARAITYLIVAQNGTGNIDALATLDNIYRSTKIRPISAPDASDDLPAITDDRAFATGLLIANLGIGPLVMGIAGIGLVLALVGILLAVLLGRGSKSIQPQPSRWYYWAAALTGFNFMTLEYLVVYRLMRLIDVPMDATYLGMALFAILAALGSLFLTNRSSRGVMVASILVALPTALSGFWLPSLSLIFIVAASIISGSLFPRILRMQDGLLARVYVWDAYGTLWGGLAALLVPLFGGFSGHQVMCGLAFVGASLAIHFVCRDGHGERNT